MTNGVAVPNEKFKKKGCVFTYAMVEYDIDGWVDAARFLPALFDLVILKLEKGSVMGWNQGTSWDGARYEPGSKVLYWKRLKEEA